MILPIVKYGQPVLKTPSTKIGTVTPEIKELVQNMLETMYDAEGVGLAAQQVGRTERVCVIDVPRDADYKDCVGLNDHVKMPLVLIDPVVSAPENPQRKSEGCLSFPGLYVDITRAKTVTVEYTDLEGERKTATVHGLLARAVQHECDHLDGVLMSDKFSTTQRIANKGRLRRIQQGID